MLQLSDSTPLSAPSAGGCLYQHPPSNVPPPPQVDRLVELLSSRKMGVVAHFYMDPEVGGQAGGQDLSMFLSHFYQLSLLPPLAPSPPLQVQGVLMSAAERWPQIYISDSLVMADTAVKMAEEGCKWVYVSSCGMVLKDPLLLSYTTHISALH